MWKRLMKELDLSDSYISMGLGLLVVLIVGVLLFNYFSGRGEPTISEEGQTSEQEMTELPATHTVTEGETLWSISEQYFQSGYNWQDIADANGLTGQEELEVGQELTIPNVTPALLTEGEEVSPTPEAVMEEEQAIEEPEDAMVEEEQVMEETTEEPVVMEEAQETQVEEPTVGGVTASSTSYTVVHGDSLWKIAVAKYNDGYRWVDIARANNLANPDVIHAGNVLTLPQ